MNPKHEPDHGEEDINLLPQKNTTEFAPGRLRCLSINNQVVLLFCILVNIFVGWQLFGPLADNGASDFDDSLWLRDTNQRDTLGKIFHPTLKTGNELRDAYFVPLQSIVFYVSAKVLDQRLLFARFLMLWLHILNSLLFLILAFRFCRSITASHIISLVFLLHPINVGTLTWLSAAVSHCFALFFYLIAFMLMQSFLHYKTWWRLPLAFFVSLLAMLTKENAVTLFALFLLYDVLLIIGWKNLWPFDRKIYLGLLIRHGPFLLLTVGFIAIQLFNYQEGAVANKFGGVEIGARCLIRIMELLSLVFYFGSGWNKDIILLAITGVTLAFMIGLYYARRKPLYLFFILSIFIFMTPFSISNFRGALALGRYTYQVTAFVFLLFAILLVKILKQWPFLKWPALNLLCASLAFMAYRITQSIN